MVQPGMMMRRASVPHGNYGTTLLGSIGGGVSLALLGSWRADAIQQHANTSDAVGFLLTIGLLVGGLWLGSILGSTLLLWWRGAGGVRATALRLALLIPITLLLALGLPGLVGSGFLNGLAGVLPPGAVLPIMLSVVLLPPTLLARAWAIKRTRRFGLS